jgi:ketosteroid isomerase-like protein
MMIMSLANIVQRGWEAVESGDFDTLVSDYEDEMAFIMPGQENALHGKAAFRSALDGLGEILPPGFEIIGLRQIEGSNEVVSIVEWKSSKVESSQLAVLFKFRENKIFEERWFIDTVQWKSSF